MTQLAVAKARKTRSKTLKTAPKRTRKAKRGKSLTLGFALIGWAILAMLTAGATAYAEMSTEIVYVAEVATSTPVEIVEKKPETIVQKIDRVADENNIPRWKLHALAQCESSMNPKAKNISSVESSHGLFQINIKAHEVTIAQAQDPDFALAFVAKNWKKRYNMWYNCSRANSL